MYHHPMLKGPSRHMRDRLHRSRARLLDWRDTLRLADWPRGDGAANNAADARVGVVIASYNTCDVLGWCLFGLFRVLADPRVVRVVVVDNGSTDGTLDLLDALRDAGLISVRINRRQEGHGVALNQGIELLRREQLAAKPGEGLDYLWMLDSDALVLRPDVLDCVLPRMQADGACLAGEYLPREMLPEIDGYAHPSSLLIRPSALWRRPIVPFDRSGAPALRLQQRMQRLGWMRLDFPFMAGGYVLHVGRSTLQAVWRDQEQRHSMFAWASENSQPHYHGHPRGPAMLRSFLDVMQREVGAPKQGALVRTLTARTRVDLPRVLA